MSKDNTLFLPLHEHSFPERLSLREKIGQTCQIHGEQLGPYSGAGLEDFFGRNPVGSIFMGSEIIGSKAMDAAELKRLVLQLPGGQSRPAVDCGRS